MLRSLLMIALTTMTGLAHAQGLQDTATDVQVLWAGDDALVFVDTPSEQMDRNIHKQFFYQELQHKTPNILLVMVNEADCSQTGRLRTHQVALVDINTASVTNPEQTDVLERNEWKNYTSETSIHSRVWEYICRPETREEKGFVASASVHELISTYMEVAAEYQRNKKSTETSTAN